MKRIAGFFLILGFCGMANAGEPPSAMDSLNALVSSQEELSIPVPERGLAAEQAEKTLLPDKGRYFPMHNDPVMEACRGERSCFMALDGEERGLCEAYKEDKSCFMALDREERGWCEVLKEGKSCFMALDGQEREDCRNGRYPGKHMFWAHCGNIPLPKPENPNPVMEACYGEKSCFMALDGEERGFCEAYKEDKSCFMALDGTDRAWCEVMKEGKSCFMALDGLERERCENGRYPWKHLFWQHCGERK